MITSSISRRLRAGFTSSRMQLNTQMHIAAICLFR